MRHRFSRRFEFRLDFSLGSPKRFEDSDFNQAAVACLGERLDTYQLSTPKTARQTDQVRKTKTDGTFIIYLDAYYSIDLGSQELGALWVFA
jgi:hypothetical protein